MLNASYLNQFEVNHYIAMVPPAISTVYTNYGPRVYTKKKATYINVRKRRIEVV